MLDLEKIRQRILEIAYDYGYSTGITVDKIYIIIVPYCKRVEVYDLSLSGAFLKLIDSRCGYYQTLPIKYKDLAWISDWGEKFPADENEVANRIINLVYEFAKTNTNPTDEEKIEIYKLEEQIRQITLDISMCQNKIEELIIEKLSIGNRIFQIKHKEG